MASDKIKVAVRVRPFSKREMELGTACIVDMDTARNQTILHHPLQKDRHQPPKTFAFDHCFKSLDPNDSNFASQEQVFECVGKDILNNALKGYNACIFAYGQTGSGKSYSMMGTQKGTEKGIIPRLCDSLFERIETVSSPENEAKVEVSYMEIYNEKVHDLLDLTSSNKSGLKVREHNVLGPYVDGLSQLAVISYQEIDDLMIEGNKSRTVAATNMNNESSRSHAVFTIILTFTLTDPVTGVTGEKVSRMSLVDLAGSERAIKTGAVGERLKEGSNINRSLTTLGLVISKLAEHSTGKSKDKFVPYRDSVLTWLLKDNLGGNSKTVMVATISPSGDNYEETLSTLRYADRAKKIVNHAVVNEDPNARIIRELRGEVEMLKEMLLLSAQPELLKEKLSENEKLMKEMSLTWEEKLHKTEQKQEDRRHALEKMGISIQSSGIKVEKNKYFLVNLNADPSLNELLVYYLKECTLVGRAGTTPEQDIQLMGLGIQAEHCIIQIENTELYITPLPGARTCINGSEITSRTQLGNGDRILWGSNHFFRVNCPKVSASSCDPTPTTPFDWKMAQEEVMMEDVGSAPMKDAMARLERQYEEDKQTALENQRKEYEKQFQQLKNFMSPSTPFAPFVPYDPFRVGKITPSTPTVLSRLERWGQDRDEIFKRSLNKLREDIIRANGLVREANSLADEMDKATSFSVTLQIPPHNLSPNRKRGAFVSEPAILVKRKLKGSQVWSMEKLDSKLIDMRDLYEELKCKRTNSDVVEFPDPFYETTESHNLIGVANIFLDVLFEDVKLDYQTPIISQQGEVAGRLQIEIQRIGGSFPNDRMAMCETNSESSEGSSSRNSSMLGHEDSDSSSITCKVTIKGATGLPPSLSHFVFCQYMFWGDSDITVVPPVVNTDSPLGRQREHDDSASFKFDYTRTFTVPVTEEFIEHCSEGALSIEVYGHRSTGFANAWEEEQQRAKARSLADRWSELTRKLEFRVEIQELNEAGEYSGVEVHARDDVGAGGVMQLRQGQQRRIVAWVKPVHNSGTLPIICESISSIAVGGPCVRSKLQKPLDSYQEEDLARLRERWSEALGRRRQYLDGHIQKYINKGDKTDAEVEREQSLVEQWVCLTDERNAVLVPSEGAGVPGAPTPTDWDPKPGMETHSPVLFLDLNADDFSTGYTPAEDQITMFGHNSILPKEHGGKFFNLPIIRYLDKEVGAVASWDSSVHDSVYLNRITQGNERAYLIVKAVVRLSHPCTMDLVLRKRLCLNIFKRHSITDKIRRKIVPTSSLTSVGVIYEIVSNVPKASEELEDRESLAVMAASGQDLETGDGETFIEKYTRGVSAVETILTLDRLRQNVSVKEMITAKGKMTDGRSMRKTVSVPNFTNMMSTSMSLDNISSLAIRSSESFQELNLELAGRNRKSLPSASQHQAEDPIKPFGLETVPEADAADCDNVGSTSPANNGVKRPTRMSTLHEEKLVQQEGGAATEERNDVNDSSECNRVQGDSTLTTEVAKPVSEMPCEMSRLPARLPTSQTYESLNELQPKTGTPSLVSSGYGSQAVSSTTLSSEDSLSVRSISVDDTPDTENQLLDPPRVRHEPPAIPDLTNQISQLGLDMDTYLLSPPDVSLTSISPGEDTDHTVTVETTPSSANITPSQSVDVVGRDSSGSHVVGRDTNGGHVVGRDTNGGHVVGRDTNGGHVVGRDACGGHVVGRDSIETGVVRRQGGRRAANNPNRSSCPTNLSTQETMMQNGLNAGSDTNLRNNIGSEINLKNNMGSDTNLQRSKNSFDTNLKSKNNLEPKLGSKNGSDSNLVYNDGSDSNLSNTSSDRLNCTDDEELVSPEICNVDLSSLPDWITLGESVQIRPSNYSGVIAYIGGTEFAPGPWIGVELDTPQGKNDGSVKGVRYFTCPNKKGMFVKSQKLCLDKRGREMRMRRQNSSMETSMNSSMRKSMSKGGLTSSKSRNKL